MVYHISFVIILLLIFLSECNLNHVRRLVSENLRSQYYLKDALRIQKAAFIFCFLILFTIAAIRYNVGVDFGVYTRLQIPRVLSGDFGAVEPLGAIVFIIGASLGSYQYIFALIHLIIIFFVAKAIYRNYPIHYSLAIFLLLFTGFFNTSMNLMRQAMAMAVFLYSIKYIYERKIVKHYILIFIALMFHLTALFYLPAYFLYGLKFSKKNVSIGLIAGGILIYSFEWFLEWVTVTFGILRNYWGATEMAIWTDHYFSPTHFIANTTVLVCMIIMRIFANDIESVVKKRLDFAIYLQSITIIIMVVSLVTFLPNFDRIVLLFSSAQIITLPLFFQLKMSKLLKQIMFACIATVLVFSFYWLIMFQNIGGTFPYQTIFN
jgi:hypothetical protein